MNHAQYAFTLPPSVMTLSDLRRLVNEIEAIDITLTTNELHRKVAAQRVDSPISVTAQLSDFITTNNLDLRNATTRAQVIAAMRLFKTTVPVVHLTFAVSATRDILGKMVQQLRQALGGQTVITVGLQPDLIGGVVIRTANRIFDFSTKSQLAGSRKVIVKELEAIDGIK